MAVITFTTNPLPPREASINFRTALGAIACLRDSLLGNNPKVFGADSEGGFNRKYHQKVRKFSDAETLGKFVDYLRGVIAETPDPHPTLSSSEGMPIRYQVASGRAEIGIITSPDGWRVTGSASFLCPDIAIKILKNNGFTVETEVI